MRPLLSSRSTMIDRLMFVGRLRDRDKPALSARVCAWTGTLTPATQPDQGHRFVDTNDERR